MSDVPKYEGSRLPTVERVRELVAYDSATGVFTRRVSVARTPKSAAGTVAGAMRADGYLIFGVDGRTYLAHRLAWLYVHGAWPAKVIDHINGNRSDNRIENLRSVTQIENMRNRSGPAKHNKTGFLGVIARRGGFRASIKTCPGKSKYLGHFATAAEASAAYLAAKAEFHR